MSLRVGRLLPAMRDVYDLPRELRPEGERFRRFRELNERGLPLSTANPMAHDHVPEAIDVLLDLGAEAIAIEACIELVDELEDPDLCVGIVVADPKGRWTDRHLTEAEHRFAAQPPGGWAVTLLWADDVLDAETVWQAVVAEVVRSTHRLRSGPSTTLDEVLRREGHALARAGTDVGLDAAACAEAELLIEPHLDSPSFPTWVAAMLGDPGARAGGYTPLGLPARAGDAVAIDRYLASE